MNALTIVFFIAVLHHIHALCTKKGLHCLDCNELVECIEQDDGEFRAVHVANCQPSQNCLVDSCSLRIDPTCDFLDKVEFKCNDIGMFPDPLDCQTYHICVGDPQNPQEYVQKCDEDHGYDPKTTYCSLVLETGKCPSRPPVPPCESFGQSAALEKNPSIYYICEEYDPSLATTISSSNATNAFNTSSSISFASPSPTSRRIPYPYQYLCPHGTIYENSECAENTTNMTSSTSIDYRN